MPDMTAPATPAALAAAESDDYDLEPVILCPRTKQPCLPNSGGWSCDDMGCWLIYGEDDDL